MYQFKVPHRYQRPDFIHYDLFSDFDFPEPETFNDDYFCRLAASENMMEIENRFKSKRYEINCTNWCLKIRFNALASLWRR